MPPAAFPDAPGNRDPRRTKKRRHSDSALRDAAVRIVRTLRDNGHVAYLAGGCVRDEIMGLPPKDYDVATDATPDRVASLFPDTRAVGEHFGVLLVNISKYPIEVATFRTEWGYTDNRRPDKIVFSDAEHDARRRDFTINGLFKDPITDEIIDYVNGQSDLRAKILRAIGHPAERLAEDHLRALRAVRLAARLGFTIEPATADAVRRDASALRGVSRERIGQEVRIMFTHASRAMAAALLQSLSLDAPVLNSEPCQRAPAFLAALPADSLYPTALAAWALDRHADPTDVPTLWRSALMLSNDERDDLAAILIGYSLLTQSWDSMTIARQKRLAARPHFSAILDLVAASDPDRASKVRKAVGQLARTPAGLAPTPLLSGDDLIAMGYSPGPDFKNLLDALYDAQLEGQVADLESARALARQLASAPTPPPAARPPKTNPNPA